MIGLTSVVTEAKSVLADGPTVRPTCTSLSTDEATMTNGAVQGLPHMAYLNGARIAVPMDIGQNTQPVLFILSIKQLTNALFQQT